RELGPAGGRDVHLLARVGGIATRARGSLLRLELAEAGERDVPAALQRVGDGVQERIDGLACVARRELAPPGHLRDELLLGHVPLLLSLDCGDPNRAAFTAQPCGFAGLFAVPSNSAARKIGRSRTACRASASAPP